MDITKDYLNEGIDQFLISLIIIIMLILMAEQQR